MMITMFGLIHNPTSGACMDFGGEENNILKYEYSILQERSYALLEEKSKLDDERIASLNLRNCMKRSAACCLLSFLRNL